MKIPSKYSNKEKLLGLYLIEGISQGTIRRLLGDRKNINFSLLKPSQKIGLGKFDWGFLDSYLSNLREKKIFYNCCLDEDYPKSLMEIVDYPPILFYKGDIRVLSKPCFSIVGTRKISSYGQRCVEKFVPVFVDKGWVIVSGMAFGVDYYAHQTTLNCGGKTIAVLASGVDIPSPATNVKLYESILREGGLIISELLPGKKPVSGFFPMRNRIISGLSLGTLIVEAGKKSGSLITACSAFEQNRCVFAIPGDVGKFGSFGTNKIISDGIAKLVTCPKEVLEEFCFVKKSGVRSEIPVKFDNILEENIYGMILKEGSLAIDDIVSVQKVNVVEVSKILTKMELKGMLTTIDSKYVISL